ncbi:MAG: S8 family serine peptidase [Sulfitobacter sp.]
MAVQDMNDPLEDVKNHLTDFRLTLDDGTDQWWSALLTLQGGSAGISIDGFIEMITPDMAQDLIVPVVYSVSDRAVAHNRFFLSVIARKSTLDTLNRADTYPVVTNVDLGTHVDKAHIDFDAKPQESPINKTEVPRDTVIMAVIDDGIAIAHNLFRDTQSSTRIIHADLLAVVPDRVAGDATYGRRMNKSDIDSLLEQCLVDGILDEAAFYRATGQVNYFSSSFDPISQRRSHGTHVTALAAGYPIDAAVQNRPIICAALPAAVTRDVTGQSLLPSLALALHSLSNIAQQYVLAGTTETPPVVLNFSYGNSSGPHDGTDETSALLEWYAARVPDQKLWMTLPSGNDNLKEGHGVLPLGEEGCASSLTMVALPDDRTASHVEIWVPFGLEQAAISRIQISVSTPWGETCDFAPSGACCGQKLHDGSGRVIGRISYAFKPEPTERGVFTISIAPTYSLDQNIQTAPAGRWGITATTLPGAGKFEGDLKVWIRRDESQPGYNPGGRQSYFVDPQYQRFGAFGMPIVVDPVPDTSLIRRAGTISGFACGQSPVVVASMTKKTGQPSSYSASGPVTNTPNSPVDPSRTTPDTAAKGDDSLVLGGVISAGTSSGSFVRMNGTSVAAPRLARFAADHIAAADGSGREFVFEYLGSPDHLDQRIGAGAIDDIEVPWRTS